MVEEKQYYPSVEKFIKKKFNCIKTETNRGYLELGLVDVAGAYETSSVYHSDVELIIVEVKTSTSSFGKSLGQALGYSIYGERCFLAITFKDNNSFSQEHQYLADHLGIGLIKIPVDSNNKPINSLIEMISSSKKHTPVMSQKKYFLHSIGLSRCASCGVYGEENKMYKIKYNTMRKGLFMNNSIQKVYLCRNCYNLIIPEKERLRRQQKNNIVKKAVKTRKLRKTAQKAIETRKRNKSMKRENL